LIHTTGSLVQVGDRLIGARPCARRLIPSLLEALLGLGQAYSGEVELLYEHGQLIVERIQALFGISNVLLAGRCGGE
jgi:hypothetical protein